MPENGKFTSIPQALSGSYRDSRDHEPSLVWNYGIKGILRRGETSVLYGPPNCGKSALVCYIGHRIATGQTCFGARVQKGITVHVGAEAAESVLDRMKAYPTNHKAAGPYIVRLSAVDLSSAEQVQKFIEDLKQIHHHTGEKIILVVFDTLARSIGQADENCAQAMTGIVNAADAIARAVKAHVMLVHHTGKDVERGGRGSSALRGAVDTELSLLPLKSGTVVVSQEKQRTMPKSPPVYFRTEPHVLGLDEDGEDRTTVKAVEVEGPPQPEPVKKTTGDTGCSQAVHTALYIRRMTGAQATLPFRPRDILETLPPELFGAISDESRLRSIVRTLEKLAKTNTPIVEKTSEGWCLTNPERRPSTNG